MPVARSLVLAFLLAALAAMPALAEPGHWRSVFKHRPPVPRTIGAEAPPVDSCAARLAAAGARFERARPEAPADPACLVGDPVTVLSIGQGDQRVALPDKPLLDCAFAERFAGFVADIAAPLARGHLGRRLTALGTGPGRECRPRNRVPGAKISAHGRGIAVDVSAFLFEQGGRVTVEKPGDDRERRFVAAVRLAACGAFTTVLGPGADPAHADHLHLDYEIRGRSGDRYRICQ